MLGYNLFRFYYLRIQYLIRTIYTRIVAKHLVGIELGKKCSFQGKTIYFKTKMSSIDIGENCRFLSKANGFNLIGINRPCIISTQTAIAKIIIGNNCGFSGTVISAFSTIKIGNNVKCGANTLITDSDWHLEDTRSGEPKEIIIEDNVWLGEGVKVLKGVIIGENSVIGAGSIVTKNIPKNVIAAGNPCRILKEIS